VINCFLLDDEQDCIENLIFFLNLYCPDAKIAGTANTIEEALQKIPTLKIDIAFFDIRLKNGLSFEVLDKLKQVDFDLIFVTAFDTYAIKAFKYSALDYLLKPIEPDDLLETFNRVTNRKNKQDAEQVDLLIENIKENKFDRIVITTHKGMVYLDVADIIRCSAKGSYTTFHTHKNELYIATGLLKEYSEILPEENFIRIHRSHVVNVSQLRLVGNDYVELHDDTQVPLARRRKKIVEEKMKAS